MFRHSIARLNKRFSLSNLQFELDLPIEVVKGTVGKVSIDIPWTTLYSDPILVHLEDILILAAPVSERQYDAELEKRLIRAKKQKILEDVKRSQPFHTLFDNIAVKSKGFFENLLATVVNNVQISIQNVHIRYEDTVSRSDGYAICFGVAFQSLTAITTNNKWKPTQIDSNSSNIFKLIKLETFYAYLNPRVDQQRLAKNDVKLIHWTSLMKTSIFNCSLCEEEFDFVIKPIIAKVKLIFNKSKELRVPKLLVDCVLQDAAVEISQSQYVSVLRVVDNFMRIEINRKFMKYKPSSLLSMKSKERLRALWKYAYDSIMEEYVRPYSWCKIIAHRESYRKYKSLYKQRLLNPSDSELKVDLQKAEDSLDICNILIAQEDAKLEIAKQEPSFVEPLTDDVDGGTNVFNSHWMYWLGFGFSKRTNHAPLIEIKSEKENLWSKFTSEEKVKVNEMVQSFGESSSTLESIVDFDKYIAHKINVTLANITVSLISGSHNGDKKEILVASLNQFLASFETRPSANGFKLSLRAETFIVEGVAGGSSHYEIIPIITADKSVTNSGNANVNTNTSHKTHVFGIDVEKNPLNLKAKYSITGQVEPIEILYQQQSYIEVIRFFFDVPFLDAFAREKEVKALLKDAIEKTSRLSKRRVMEFVLEKQSLIYWNVDLKSPYFVVPECGAIERSGRVLVIDFGRLLIKSDLQQESAVFDKTNITASEMEEKLYDRISITLSDVQILFSDAGDEWRVAKELPESDIHLMPRLHIHFVCSRSLRPDYVMAPKYKLNVIVAALKFNLSDRRIRLLSDFLLNVPLPVFTRNSDKTDSPGNDIVNSQPLFDLDSKWIQRELNSNELNGIRYSLSAVVIAVEEADDSQCVSHPSSVDAVVDTLSVSQKTANNEDDEYYSASDVSEYDDSELVSWVRNIDLPGFEDNVSPSNLISMMIRFTIGEVLIQLSRSSDICDKPYLMLRLEKLNVDLSFMTYGQALQASLRRIQLVDKQQSSLTGGYLELLNSTSETEMITLLYRKVKATCPDFKSHFHHVEHSLIIDVNTLSVTFHRESLITMARFITYVIDSIPMRLLTNIKSQVTSIIPESPTSLILIRKQSDPPIPSGATKYSISIRFFRVDINLCETELNFAKLEICGLEFDYIQKANEKYVIRMDVSQLNVFDESEDTLYQKIFYMENDEKIFDFKYVRKSDVLSEESQLTEKEGDKKSSDVDNNCDGSLRLRVGHIRFVFLLKFLVNFYHFLIPFMLPQSLRNSFKKTASKNIQESVEKVAERKLRLELNITIKSPTILIPQKANSPNVIVCNFGNLTIENFFSSMKIDSVPNTTQLIDNMLMRLNGFHILRRNVKISSDGSIVMEHCNNGSYILQPVNVRLDMKQALFPRVASIEVIPISVSAEMESVKFRLSETDLSICMSIYQENFEEGLQSLKTCGDNSARISPNIVSPQTPDVSVINVNQTQDDSALVYFLSNSAEGFKDKCVRFILEGVEIVFVTTSPHSDHCLSPLCRFTLDDISFLLCSFLGNSYEAKFSLHSFLVEDLRKESMSNVKTIFQPYNPSSHPSVDPRFSLKTPPMFDLTYKASQNDGHIDVMIERTRFNLSVPFLSAVYSFISNSVSTHIVHDTVDVSFGNLINDQFQNLGYKKRLPSDITSGFHSTAADDFDMPAKESFSVSAVLKKMEIILFANPSDINSRLLVLRFDSIYDYTRNIDHKQNVLSLIGIQVMSCLNGKRSGTASMVLYPMDVEFSRNNKNNQVVVDVRLSDIDVRLSSPIVRVFIDLTTEVLQYFHVKKETMNGGNKEDIASPLLWQQRRIYVEKWMNYIALNHLLSEQKAVIFKPRFANETMNVNPFEVKFYFEVFNKQKLVPILYIKLAIEASLKNWSKDIAMQANCQFDAMFFNRNLSIWEPLLEPVMEDENKYKPLELNIKLFSDVAYPVSCIQNCRFDNNSLPLDDFDSAVKEEGSIEGSHSKIISATGTSTDESDTDSETIIIKPKKTSQSIVKNSPSVKLTESVKSIPAIIESSDSENEEGVFGKIASAFGHLISDQSSEDERENDLLGSDVEDSVGDAVAAENITEQSNTGGSETTDSELVTEQANEKVTTDCSSKSDDTTSIYCVVTVKDKIDTNVTPVLLENIEEFINVIRNPTKLSLIEHNLLKSNFKESGDSDEEDTQIHNFLGPEGVVKILKKEENPVELRYTCRVESSGRDICPSNAPKPSKLSNLNVKNRKAYGDVLVEVDSEANLDVNVCFDDAIDGCFQSKPTASETLPLNSCELHSAHFEPDLSSLYEKHSRERLSIEISGFNKLQLPSPRKAMKAIYPLQQEKGTDKGVQSRIRYFVVVDVDMRYGLKVITVSSPLVVENNLGRPVLLLCLKDSLQRIGAAVDDYARNPFHEKYVQLALLDTDCKFNVSLLVAYHCQLFLQPLTLTKEEPSFELSAEGLWWQEIVKSVASGSTKRCKYIKCPAVEEAKTDFWIKVIPKQNKEIKAPNTGIRTVPNLTLHLYPPLVIHNALCYPLNLISKSDANNQLSQERLVLLSEGESVSFFNIDPKSNYEFVVELKNYIGCQWKGRLCLNSGQQEDDFKKIPMTRFSSEKSFTDKDDFLNKKYSQLTIFVHYKSVNEEALHVYLYSPYWIVNKTGFRDLQIRGCRSDTIYESIDENEPVLFKLQRRKPKKAKIRVNDANWSSGIPMDTVGNKGVIVVRDCIRRKKYRFFVDVKLSEYCFLTKIIVIKPYFVIHNATNYQLSFMEESDEKDLWFDIASNSFTAFYPDSESMNMFIKEKDAKISSHHFAINYQHNTVLRMDSLRALTVAVNVFEDDSTLIKINNYSKGEIPVRVENYCEDVFLKIHQKQMGQVTLLSPFQSVNYTWDDPCSERVLIWNLYNRKASGFIACIEKDGFGEELVAFQTVKQYSVPSKRKTTTRRSRSPTHRQPSRRKSVPLPSVSSDSDDSEFDKCDEIPKRKLRKDRVAVYWVSFIDPDDNQRVLLFTQDERIAVEARKNISGQLAKWELFITLNSGFGLSLINEKYQEIAYLSSYCGPAVWEIEVSHKWKPLNVELSAWLEDQWLHEAKVAKLKTYIEVDLTPTKMVLTKPFYGKLRRIFNPSVSIQVRKSANQLYLNAKLYKLQLDNQLPNAVFPVVLHAKAQSKLGCTKPFIEISLFLCHKTNDARKGYKSHVFVVKYLKTLIQEFKLNVDNGFVQSLGNLYKHCISKQSIHSVTIAEDLKHVSKDISVQSNESKQTFVFEYLHLSPMKFEVSFTLRNSVNSMSHSIKDDLFEFVINTVGATLTDFKDLKLNTIYFEVVNTSLSLKRLFSMVKSHFYLQVLRQFYVFVLGLDVLGNPFGLLRDFTSGVNDRFYEPGDSATLEPDKYATSIADAMSKMVGHVVCCTSQSLALISGTFGNVAASLTFDEYFKKRRQSRFEAQSKTIQDILSQASKGFAFGVVLGISGVFTKPVVGAYEEGVEGFFKGVGKGFFGLVTKPGSAVFDVVTLTFDGIRRLMETDDSIIIRTRLPRFINPQMGLFNYSPYEAKGYRILRSLNRNDEIYWCHVPVTKFDTGDVVLVTLSNVYLLNNCRFWGGFDVEWIVNVEDLMSIPVINNNSVILKIGQFPDSVIEYRIDCESDPLVVKWLKAKIEELMLFNMSDKSCVICV